jgi:hypothetical protein
MDLPPLSKPTEALLYRFLFMRYPNLRYLSKGNVEQMVGLGRSPEKGVVLDLPATACLPALASSQHRRNIKDTTYQIDTPLSTPPRRGMKPTCSIVIGTD